VRPSVGSTVAGTAIEVALMPALCVVGLALAAGQWSWVQGASMLFGTNFLGIALSCMIVYVADGQVAKHNQFALITTCVVTAALLIPLSASFYENRARGENRIADSV
jgi:uncharacterized membrane protein